MITSFFGTQVVTISAKKGVDVS